MSGYTKWLDGHLYELQLLYRYYDRWKTAEGLLHQPAYADWQDSVKREGESFYLNLLYLDVSRRLGEASGTTTAERAAFEAKVKVRFYDEHTGLYRSLAGKSYVSLDGNLLALDLGYVDADSDEGRALYAKLKASPMWTRGGVPGSATVGDYPKAWLHLPAKLSGLSHYHDEMHWSSLTALSAKVAHQRATSTSRGESSTASASWPRATAASARSIAAGWAMRCRVRSARCSIGRRYRSAGARASCSTRSPRRATELGSLA